MSEVKRYADRDVMQLDRDGSHYCNHVLAMTVEGLHDKSDIAAELAFRDAEIDRVTAERDAALLELSEIKESLAYRGSLLCRIEGQRDALQQSLTAADERVDQAETIIRKWKAIFGESMVRRSELYVITDEFLAALKPAEGGGDEHVCTGCGAKGWTANCKECVPY